MVIRRIRHHLSRIPYADRVDALYNLFLYLYLYCHHAYFIKPLYISRVSQAHATQTQGLRPHVPQIVIPPRQMKA